MLAQNVTENSFIRVEGPIVETHSEDDSPIHVKKAFQDFLNPKAIVEETGIGKNAHRVEVKSRVFRSKHEAFAGMLRLKEMNEQDQSTKMSGFQIHVRFDQKVRESDRIADYVRFSEANQTKKIIGDEDIAKGRENHCSRDLPAQLIARSATQYNGALTKDHQIIADIKLHKMNYYEKNVTSLTLIKKP